MFEFMRKKKENAELVKSSKAEADEQKSKGRYKLRGNFIIQDSKVDVFTKKARRTSVPSMSKTSGEQLSNRPLYLRAQSSSCSAVSSFDIRNPFQDQTEDTGMTASQVALTESMSSLTPPATNMRYVARHSPVIVSPQAERAEVFYSADAPTGDMTTSNVFSDDAFDAPFSSKTIDELGMVPYQPEKEEATPSRGNSLKASRATSRRSVDYLQAKIPSSVMSSPLGGPHRESWARI